MAINVIKGNGISTVLRGALFDDTILGFGVTQGAGGLVIDADKNWNETMYGGGGIDKLYGGGGNDILYGDAGNDLLYGGSGNDKLYGGIGKDTLDGGTGNDTLNGEAGDDVLYGDKGNDTMNGGAGNDTLYAGAGNDYLDGGPDTDTAIFITPFNLATFTWSSWGNKLIVTTAAEGVDTLVNMENLAFPGFRIGIYEVIATDDSIEANENLLNVAAAFLLSNDLSVRPLTIQTDPSGIIGQTSDLEGVTIYLGGDGFLHFAADETGYDHLAEDDTHVTQFTYTVDNGIGTTDSAAVELTIYGVNDAPTIEATEPKPLYLDGEIFPPPGIFAAKGIFNGFLQSVSDLTRDDVDDDDTANYVTFEDGWRPWRGEMAMPSETLTPVETTLFAQRGQYGMAILDIEADTLTYSMDFYPGPYVNEVKRGGQFNGSATETFTVTVRDNFDAEATVDVDFTVVFPTNYSFEFDFAGWDYLENSVVVGEERYGGGDAKVSYGVAPFVDPGFAIITPPDGSWQARIIGDGNTQAGVEAFLGLAPDSLDVLDENTFSGSAIKTAIYAESNVYISFDWYFVATDYIDWDLVTDDYMPYNDYCFYMVNDEVYKITDVATVGPDSLEGDTAFSGWYTTTFFLEVAAAGDFEIGFGAMNFEDEDYSPVLYIDNITVTPDLI